MPLSFASPGGVGVEVHFSDFAAAAPLVSAESLAMAPLPLTPDMTPDMTPDEIADEIVALAEAQAARDPAGQALALAMPMGTALIAGLAGPDAGVGALALTLAGQTRAGAAADHMARAWARVPSTVSAATFAALSGPAQVTVTGKGPFVTRLIVPGTSGADLRHAGFDLLLDAWMRRRRAVPAAALGADHSGAQAACSQSSAPPSTRGRISASTRA